IGTVVPIPTQTISNEIQTIGGQACDAATKGDNNSMTFLLNPQGMPTMTARANTRNKPTMPLKRVMNRCRQQSFSANNWNMAMAVSHGVGINWEPKNKDANHQEAKMTMIEKRYFKSLFP
ncbi:MAG: hypothetical protein IMF11_22400, partial [Proteobacteria bacterium]|nr:hypothetical protein [Pseudomonadota bacterium]